MNTTRWAGRLWRALAAAAVCVAFTTPALADTGGLRVTVTNSAGEPVAGATVHASTPESLVERSGVTGEDGSVRIEALAPSDRYEVVVSGEGFEDITYQNVKVVSGRTYPLDYVIPGPDTDIEEVVVTGESGARPLVDTTSAMVATDVTLDLTESLPTGRTYQSYLQLAPTTKPTLNGNPSSKSGVNYSDIVDANGNTFGVSSDNVYYIDGVNITDNRSGTFGANFNSEIIQEMQIITGGVPAEYAGGAGLISRVVTKSGSNEFHGSVNYYTQSDSLVADNENLPSSTFSTFDTAFTLGGPIVRDKLWFFASMQRKERDEDIIDPNTGAFLRTVNTTQDLGFGKLTWQVTENDQLLAEYFNDPYERTGSDDIATLNNRDRARVQGGDNFKFAYTHTWDNLIASIDYYSHEGELSSIAADKTTRNDVAYMASQPGITNVDTDLGGAGSDSIQFRNKDGIGLTLEYFVDTDYGYHDIKFGYSQVDNEAFVDSVYTGDGAQYTSLGAVHSGLTLDQYTDTSVAWTGAKDLSRDDYQRIIDAMEASAQAAQYEALLDTDGSGDISLTEVGLATLDSTAGNPGGMVNVYRIVQAQTAPVTVKSEGDVFYLQDSWNINEHWTVNAGIRSEKWEHYATDGSKIFTFDHEIAPRLSVIYDLFGDGRSKVWVFGGRYFDPVRTNMTAFAGTLTGSVRNEQIYAGDQWLTFRVRGGSQVQDAFFAPTTKTPYTDEFMVGFEHALADDMSVGVTYTDRKTSDILEDYDLGIYTDPSQTGGFSLPLSYYGYDSMPSSNYVIATLAGAVRDYRGVEIAFRKRAYEDPWQLLASYSYNDANGNSNSDSNADLQGDFLYLDPRAPNVYGPQPGNVEHIIKLAGTYSWDNGFGVGATYHWNSGTLYSQTFAQYGRHTPLTSAGYEFNGAESTWLLPNTVGSQKTEPYGSLNVRAEYETFVFGDRYKAEFFLDIFNVLDDQAPIRAQDLAGGDGVYDFGIANNWVEPRRLYLGARLSF
ncbi:MAG TPA: TonB-dependent receptor [Woeseiaceae bacterium]|nr:TonB-dependent receptor [Woeseiaceae bacterium]